MKPATVLAQTAWYLGNLSAARNFAVALQDPAAAQEFWLKHAVAQAAGSGFGRAHDFGAIKGYAEFARRVPLADWTAVAPWVERIRRGEAAVLSGERVTHLAPTSGTTSARKLIPFTAGVQRGFSAAVGAWMHDLVRRHPALLTGPAYWSVSPLAADSAEPTGAVPVGFGDDADYLGGARAWLVRQVLAAPAELRHERDPERFWFRTARAMLGRRDLRLISVWHPSFLELLLSAIARRWDELLAVLTKDTPARARELRRAGPEGWRLWWPGLRVVSCWGEQAAQPGWRELQRKFPAVHVQAKGLLATEAVVTIPWRDATPLAVTSHFFEFLDAAGGVRRAHELERGANYEVVVTNGVLWRYRLGDLVECTGRLAATPTLRFLGRAGRVSDLRGEKLSEVFVAEVLRRRWPDGERRAWLVADPERAGYVLRVVGAPEPSLAEAIETALGENPHYALARRLGQLTALRVEFLSPETEAEALGNIRGARLGDVKPGVLFPAPSA